jgi:hypothetical protein
MEQNDLPEGGHIYDLYTGANNPHSIRVALELEIFHPWQPARQMPRLWPSVEGTAACWTTLPVGRIWQNRVINIHCGRWVLDVPMGTEQPDKTCPHLFSKSEIGGIQCLAA